MISHTFYKRMSLTPPTSPTFLARSQIIATALDRLQLSESHHTLGDTKPLLLGDAETATEVVVLLHGLTATVEQISTFAEMTQTSRKNSLVFAPPLPGHTSADTLPFGQQTETYITYMQTMAEALTQLKQSGLTVHLVGVSAGAMVCAGIAQHVQTGTLSTVQLMAPFFNPADRAAKVLFGMAHYVPRLHGILARINHGVGSGDRTLLPAPFIGHTTIGTFSCCHDVSWQVWGGLSTIKQQPSPPRVQVYTSQADTVICNNTATLASQLLEATHVTLDDQNHAMMCHRRNTPEQLGKLLGHVTDFMR